jgi:two-component system, chemotaxis family, sensor kinase CheA
MNTNPQQESFLRVKASKVSLLLDLAGELGLATRAVTHHPTLANLELVGYEDASHRLEMLIHQVQDLASSLRLVPVTELFRPAQRLVRDLAHETNKSINLILEGEDTEIDKVLIDDLKDPLTHLLRNAIDHGLESTEARKQAGKPEQGNVTLSATQRGQEIHISVTDDGRGLDREAILLQARQQGLLGATEEPDEARLWEFIFRAGFSTALEISNLSGRGVGMDVVASRVRGLRGHVKIETWRNKGTRITMIIPVTLAFLDSLIVRAGAKLYALPIEVVQEVFRPADGEMVHISADETNVVKRQGVLVPVFPWEILYGEDVEGLEENKPGPSDGIIAVVETSKGILGLPVDEVIGKQQVVMKPLEGALAGIRGGAGCALLSSGEIAMALDVDVLQQGLVEAQEKARAEDYVF